MEIESSSSQKNGSSKSVDLTTEPVPVETNGFSQKTKKSARQSKNKKQIELKKSPPVKKIVEPTEIIVAPKEESEEIQPTKVEEEKTNGNKEPEIESAESAEVVEKRVENSPKNAELSPEPVEMEPLVITDEPDPELQFDDASDKDSGKASPNVVRCRTRRSQTRNTPIPKTPKLQESELDPISEVPVDVEVDSPKKSFSESFNSACSTKAEAGGDVTRTDYIAQESSPSEDLGTRERGDNYFRELVRTPLSCRKSYRPITDEFRKHAFKNSNSFALYTSGECIEAVTTGVKRTRSESPENNKKIRLDSPSFMATITNPLINLKNKFYAPDTSTPQLTAFKDVVDDDQEEVNNDDKALCIAMPDESYKKSSCSIM